MRDRKRGQAGWDEQERASSSVFDELRRLAGRAAARPWLTLLLALVVTGAVVAYRAHKQRVYMSRIAFRVVEGDLDAGSAPRTNGRLREYVADVCFSTPRLLKLIKAHDLYPSLAKRDPLLAVEELRDDLDVEVWRNYFLEGFAEGNETREARVAVSYTGRDPQQVYEVVRDLGDLITTEAAANRRAQADAGLLAADDEVASAKARVDQVQHDLAMKQFLRPRAKTQAEAAQLLVQTVDLEQQLPKLERQLDGAQQKRERAYLRAQLEQKQLGLRFELVDGGRVAPAGISRQRLLTMIGVAVFLLSLPLAMVAVGAFDSRVYRAIDVQRLGLRSLGGVRAFDGDNVGALDERLARDGGGGRGAGVRRR